MRLKLNENKDQEHKDLASCVGWSSGEEVFSCADDHMLLKWNIKTGDYVKVIEFPESFYPTDMHWYPRPNEGSMGSKSNNDILALASTDGKYHFISRTGRIEKSVEAHTGAVLIIRWSPDGGALFTGGEDGLVKVWSRNGMLRSSLAQNPVPVYTGSWGGNSDQILYSSGKQLVIKSLQASVKPIFWKAHEGVILSTDWSSINGLIVSGGEDCKYKVWNSFGGILYTSVVHDYPITALSWSCDGNIFAVGSYDTLRLCDKNGWSYSLDKPQCGGVLSLAWSVDSTQLAAACGSGKVIFGHITNVRLEWRNYVVLLADEALVTVNNVTENSVEKLEFRDRIVKMSFKFGHLLVATSSTCYIYSIRNWNTPVVIDLKESRVTLMIQSEKLFLIIDGGSLLIYSYEGRLLCSPKSSNIQVETIHASLCSVSNDTLAVRDKQDDKVVHLFESHTGKACGDGKPLIHKIGIIDLSLDQSGTAPDRKIAIIDKNRDLYLYAVRSYGQNRRSVKLGTMVNDMCWNDNNSALVAVSGEKLLIWCYPNIAFIDKSLLSRSIIEKSSNKFGSEPTIQTFSENSVSLRKQEGSVISCFVPPYVAVLHQLFASNKLNEALTLCRSVKEECLWCCLAAISTINKDIDTAQIAYAALNDVDKVEYIEMIKRIPEKEAKQAEMLLITGNIQDAEGMLVQAGLVFRAIMVHLRLYNWDRALELAVDKPKYLPLVLAHRRKFLQGISRLENNKNYLKYQDESVPEWESVEKLMKEYEQEEKRSN